MFRKVVAHVVDSLRLYKYSIKRQELWLSVPVGVTRTNKKCLELGELGVSVGDSSNNGGKTFTSVTLVLPIHCTGSSVSTLCLSFQYQGSMRRTSQDQQWCFGREGDWVGGVGVGGGRRVTGVQRVFIPDYCTRKSFIFTFQVQCRHSPGTGVSLWMNINKKKKKGIHSKGGWLDFWF